MKVQYLTFIEHLVCSRHHNKYFSLSCIGEGNGNPLQCSCLENPRDGGAWWAAVYGVAQSRTRLKRLSSSSSSRHHKYFTDLMKERKSHWCMLAAVHGKHICRGWDQPPYQREPKLSSVSKERGYACSRNDSRGRNWAHSWAVLRK